MHPNPAPTCTPSLSSRPTLPPCAGPAGAPRPERQRAVALLWALAAAAVASLAGCAAPQSSLPLGPRAAQGFTVVRSLPQALPEGAEPLAARQLVLLVPPSGARSAAQAVTGLLIPVPFVSDAIFGAADAIGRDEARARKAQQFDGVDPHAAVLAALRASPVLTVREAPLPTATGATIAPPGLTLQPFAFVQGCDDGRFRLALVAHLQDGDWVGRYTVHLGLTLSQAEFAEPDPAVRAALREAMAEAAVPLRNLLERAVRGELRPSGRLATVGSLHLHGNSPPSTFISPTSLLERDADLIDEIPDHIVVRLAGDMTQNAAIGGLVFGVHWLRKDQLHTFETRPATASSRP
jgi:hypothetical protein